MSNKAKGKLAFTVRKSDTDNVGHETKIALPEKAQQPAVLSLLQQRQGDLSKITNNSTTPAIPSTKKNNAFTIAKRKRNTSGTKNHAITQFFTLPQTQTSALWTNTTTKIKNTTLPSSSFSNNTTNASTNENSAVPQLSLSDNSHSAEEENVACHIRYTHPVQELWATLVGEYGEVLDDCVRRVRARTEGQQQGSADSIVGGAGTDMMLLLEECLDDDMSRPVRCQMTLQESISFFNEITNELFCA